VGSISVTTTATAYNTSSDYRLKNTIVPMTGALAKVALLKPCTYKWNADSSDGEGFIAHEIAEVMPYYQTRHVIKPGLTGWAQVNYAYGETIEDSLIKLQYDLYYIKHRSLFLDFNIMFKTLSTVLFYRGQ
jgi:hypothetical protein